MLGASRRGGPRSFASASVNAQSSHNTSSSIHQPCNEEEAHRRVIRDTRLMSQLVSGQLRR